ncbi:MAG: 30S ribosomal protein S15 [Nanoarchaeota archaeon]|nr:30S ribosomal protein S15 [Nanoarchaeota archaeon]
MTKLEKPTWIKMKEPELKKTIAELAEKHAPSKIGLILRDQYGIPTTKVFGKKLKAYLKELGIERNEDLENARKKVDNLKEHLKSNVTDRSAKHKLQRAQSRLNITKKYFKISGRD